MTRPVRVWWNQGGGLIDWSHGEAQSHRAAVELANEVARYFSVVAVKIIDRRAAPIDMGTQPAGSWCACGQSGARGPHGRLWCGQVPAALGTAIAKAAKGVS
jgi:hypothetical protein